MRSSLTAALSLTLAASVAVLPVLPELHVAFASHDHHYCPEHNRIEDVYIHGDRAPVTEPDRPAVAGTVRIESPPCAVSNLVIQTQAGTRPILTTRTTRVCTAAVPVAPAPAGTPVLVRAPKHSPPAV